MNRKLLYHLRKLNGLDQQYVAGKLRMSVTTYSKIEENNSVYILNGYQLMLLSGLYGVTTDYLLGLSNDLSAAGKYQNDIPELLILLCEVEEQMSKQEYKHFIKWLHYVVSSFKEKKPLETQKVEKLLSSLDKTYCNQMLDQVNYFNSKIG